MSRQLLPDFSKQADGLLPAIIQDSESGQVLMLGYMNQQAFDLTVQNRRVTFFSRSKGRLWEKGESSGNYLELVSLSADCDSDAILVRARPAGPTCHKGTASCFNEDPGPAAQFLFSLEKLLINRIKHPAENSYSSNLLSGKLARVAQKVGEEGVEVALAALDDDKNEFAGEVADLFFHSLVLLVKKDVRLNDIIDILRKRNSSSQG